MFCHKCGIKLSDNAAFCQKCGEKIISNEGEGKQQVADKDTAAITNKHAEKAITEVNVPTEVQKATNPETTLFKNTGSQVSGISTKPGYIKLTNKRLILQSFWKKVKFEINLNDIVSYKKAYYIDPITKISANNAFIVYTKQGMEYKVLVRKRDELIQRFKEVIPLIEQRPDETASESEENSFTAMDAKDKQKAAYMRKLFLIFMVLFFIFQAVRLTMVLSNDDGAYIEAVQVMTPYDTLETSASYKEVIDTFFISPKWEERALSKELAYVDVSGTIVDGDGSILDIAITFKLTPYEGKSNDLLWIEPYSLEVDGMVQGKEETGTFLAGLFEAHHYGFNNLSDYASWILN